MRNISGLAALFLIAVSAFAQGTVTLFGSVTDPTGAAIAGAGIKATNTATARSREAISSADGSYVITDLASGTYNLTAQASGFKTFVQDSIAVQVDENRRVPIALEVGSSSQNVTVTADVAQVDTRSGALREVIDSTRIVELPLNGRNALQLQYLVPGAGGINPAGQAENESVSINGGRPNMNNYMLDGADNHDPFFNTPSVFPNPDALDEFSMQTNAYGADRGRNAGALMNAVTKSGTNRFRGTLFEFLRNDKLNARNFFSNIVPPFKRNQFGGTVGGPVRKDKTFFFASYQGTRERSSPGSQTPTVLTAAQRQGDFSNLNKALKDPLGGTFPGNIIPASRLSQPSLNFLNTFVPLPNAPNGLYSFASQQSVNDDQLISKVDHNFSANNQLSGRLVYERNDTNQVVNATTLPGFLALIQYRNWNASMNDTHTFSARIVNVFTFGFNDITRQQLPIIPSQKTWGDFGAGIVRAAPGPIGYDTELNGYFNAQSRYPLNQFRKGFQYSDGLNWTVGSHTLKFGGDLRQSMVDQNQTFQSDPQVKFTSIFTGDTGADFLIGRPSTVQEQSRNAARPRTLELDAYIQDDWKVNRRLTLNLGLRWDPFLPFHDLDNELAQVRPGQQSNIYPTAPLGYVFPGDAGVSSTTLQSRYANLAPRFGFAFDPFGNGRTSIRGGYGFFFADVRQQAMNQLSTNQPFAIKLVATNPSGGLVNPYSDTGNPFPYQPPATNSEKQNLKFFTPLTVSEWEPNFRDAEVQQWNFNVQQQVFSDWIITVAYVGSKGNHLFLTEELNPAIFGRAGKTTDARRLFFPNYSSIQSQQSVGNSTYHSLQTTANKRLAHGLTVLLNYTWSKSIDNGSDDGTVATNPFNIAAEKSVSDYDIPHRMVGSLVWALPAVNSHGALLHAIAGGWQMNGIVTLQSGSLFSILSGADNSQSGVGKDRADVVGDWHLSGDQSKNSMVNRYFNTGAFTANAAGTFGNSGRNVLRGPGNKDIDFGMIKTFTVVEASRVQFRAEAFNLLNHANLGNPNGTVSSANFGRITTAGNSRIVQLALKFLF